MFSKGVEKLKFPLKGEYIALVAPSFVINFSYPGIIYKLKKLGFDKVVELTFGAKIVNREYHKKLRGANKMYISSACTGVVSMIENKFPKFKKNILKIDSPMIAMGKICKKHFPKHKTVFISPCNFKKIEAKKSCEIDYVIDYNELENLFKKYEIKFSWFNKKLKFDKFYNDYTKIYPLSGGLAKTIHLKKILSKEEFISIDGVKDLSDFLKNPNKKIKFVDCLFCKGGCIGGPYTKQNISLGKKKKRLLNYLRKSKREDIPENRKGLVKNASGLKFSRE